MASDAMRSLRQKDIAHLIHPNTVLSEHEVAGPLILVHGKGVMVYDADGREYVDGLAGLWNCCLGHGRSDVIAAINEQMERLAFATTFYGISNDATITWAARLAEVLPGDLRRIFPNVTGSEANDTAFKFTRLYWTLAGKPSKSKIVSHSRGYHGVSLGVVNATGHSDFWKQYAPLPANHVHVPAPYCYRCPYGAAYPQCDVLCAKVLEQMIIAEEPELVAAFIAEPVISAAGIVIPKVEYYRRVREMCDRYEVLFIDDEIVTGFGRVGKWFGIEHFGVVPDMITMGKGMTAGYLPMFATAVSERIYRALTDSGETLYHGFTYTGQPVLCAAALKVMEIIKSENLLQRVDQMGALLAQHLEALTEYPWVGDVRSIGLLGGIEFVADKRSKQCFDPRKRFASRMTAALRKHGVLTRVVKGDCIVLAPPFVITEAEMARLFKGIRDAIEELCPSM